MLRDGDDRAYAILVERHGPFLRRLARTIVRTDAAAEEVVQETWLAVVAGLPAFEGRSSLRHWIASILVRRARTHAVREARCVPFSSVGREDEEEEGRRLVAAEAAAPPWAASPGAAVSPEGAALAAELRGAVDAAVAALPRRQRAVLVLRDVVGFTAREACDLLGVGDGSQRVLLHRARRSVAATLRTRQLAG